MTNTDPSIPKRTGIVCIIGPPNAGKSTLLNSFLGEKLSIVTPKPQTTRNSISGILTTGNAQVIFLDTPGVHKSQETMNSYLVETVWQTLGNADSILLVLDACVYLDNKPKLDRELNKFKDPLFNTDLPLYIALNKIDLIREKSKILELLQHVNSYFTRAEIFPVSATREQETNYLLENLVSTLPPGQFLYPKDQLSTLPTRFFVTEIVREKIFLALKQELPYSVVVKIEHWEEISQKNQVIINCVIFVSRKSQKKIIIGKNGSQLKRIGELARFEIAEMLGQKVHLELWVKVKPNWQKDINFLKNLHSAEI